MRKRYVTRVLDPEGRLLLQAEGDAPGAFHVGDELMVGGRQLHVVRIEQTVVPNNGGFDRHLLVYTSESKRTGRTDEEQNTTHFGPTADFLRYHALIRIFDGRIGDWQAILDRSSRRTSADARFLDWLQSKVAKNPTILSDIRHTIDDAGLWPDERVASSQ
jgi:hypothetical protein